MEKRWIVKKRKHWIVFAIIWGMLVSLFALGVFGWAGEKEFDKETQEKMEKTLDKVMQDSRSPAAIVGVWAPGEGTWVVAKGKADIETGQLAQIKDKTRIGSITKTFVATAVLQLVDEGKIGLDDAVNKYLSFMPTGSKVTVHQLLNHSSGIFDAENDDPIFAKAVLENPSKKLSPQEIVEVSLAHKPYNQPGKGAHYSNTNYKLLGMIVEEVTGKDLGVVIEEKIIDRLGLSNTVFATQPEMRGDRLHGYAVLESGLMDVTTERFIWILWASGNVVSNLQDQKKWARALGRGVLLSEKTHEEMMSWIEITAALPGKFKYGLGVARVGDRFIGHAGAVNGYYGGIAYDPGTDTTIVLLFNKLAATEDAEVYESFLHELIDILH
ncbi:D-aminopeptidase [subsurface metagenome]